MVQSRRLKKRFLVEQSIETEIKQLKKESEQNSGYNFKRWPILTTPLWPAAPGCEKKSTFDSEVEYLQSWLRNR